jgi:phosphate transport system substrate-binding protein
MKRLLIVLFVVTALLVTACNQTTVAPTAAPTTAPVAEKTEEPVAQTGQLQLAGSTTVQPLAEELAEAFMAKNPDLVIEIQGGGSSVGVTSAGEGTVDIGMASREIKGSEMETFPDLNVVTIAYDGIAIVTNPGIELPSLTIEQVRNIFAGEITNYSEVGGPDTPVVVVSREEGSGTRTAFEELVMTYKDANGDSQTKLIFEKALLQQSNGQVRTTVSTTPNAIAYLSFGFLDDSINTVASYPIYRPLNLLSNGAPSDLADAFISYILSPEGQEIVAEDYITAK